MRLGRNAVYGLLVLVAGAVIVSVYMLGGMAGTRTGSNASSLNAQQVQPSAPALDPALAPTHPLIGPHAEKNSSGARIHPALPPAHPRIAAVPPEADRRSGRVQVDPSRAFTHYRVGNNSVMAIYADGPVIWLGTSGGMVRYDTVSGEFRTYDTRNGLVANGILCLGKLHGRIVAGTYGGGLSMLDQEGEWEHYGTSEGLADGFVYDVLETAGGDVWIATGAGVNRIRNGIFKDRAKWDLYTAENTGGGLPHNRVYRIAADREGGVWFATRGGLARLRNGKWQNWTPFKELGVSAQVVQGANASDAGSLQLSPAFAQPAQKKQSAETGASVSPNHIAALEVAKDGNVWVGTRGAGLARYDGRAWISYSMAEGLPSNQISTLNFDSEGRLWIGTKSGLVLFKNGKFQVLTTAQGLLGDNVYSVANMKDGGIWVGGFGGVAHISRPAFD